MNEARNRTNIAWFSSNKQIKSVSTPNIALFTSSSKGNVEECYTKSLKVSSVLRRPLRHAGPVSLPFKKAAAP